MEYCAVNNSTYFQHHGRLGQKWGQKNGPPYPLDYRDLSAEERAKDKERVIKTGDVVTAGYRYNREYFTVNELNEVANRYQVNDRISKLSAEKISSGKKSADKFIENVSKVSDATNKLATGIQNTTNLYNNLAKVANSLGDKKLPIIGEKKGEDPISFTGDIDKVLANIDKYSDKQVADIKKRADNIDQLRKKQFRGNND